MRILARTLILFCIMLSACVEQENEKLTIATASNVQFVMEELVKEFTKETGVRCNITLGSSGKLMAQIKEGAPYDVFVSADMKYPEELYKMGYGVHAPEIYAYGKLVLWSLKSGSELAISMLTTNDVKHIAIANPKTAPYGVAALEVVRYYGIRKQVEGRLVYGESIAQTNQFIISRTADVGLTAKSVVLVPAMKNKGKWVEVDEAAYSPIAQGAVVLKKENKDMEAAKKFYSFLFSEKARGILETYGYKVNVKQ